VLLLDAPVRPLQGTTVVAALSHNLELQQADQ